MSEPDKQAGRIGCWSIGAIWTVLPLGTLGVVLTIFLQFSRADVTGLRGAWVRTHLSEWGTGRGGYYVNEIQADRLLLGFYVGAAAVLSGLLLVLLRRRLKRRDVLHATAALILGLWGSVLAFEALAQSNQYEHPAVSLGPAPGDSRGPMEFLAADPLPGHEGQVTSVAFSPDGVLLASGGEDKTVRLWNVATNAAIATLTGHEGEVLTVAFSPDGKLLASGSVDGTIRFWDPAAAKEMVTLRGHSDKVRSVAFSPDGKTLASAAWDKTVRLWDVRERTVIATLEGHTDAVKAVAFAPDGRTLVSGGVDKSVRIWDLSTRTTVKVLQGVGAHYSQVLSVAISPDNRWLVTTGQSGVIVWELPECAEPMHVCQGEQVWGAAFSADGKRLATCDESGVGRIWKGTGGGVWQSSAGGDIHRFIKGMAEILFSPEKIMKADGRIYGVAFSPDGRTVATGGAGEPGGSPVYGGMRPRGQPVRPGALNLWGLR